MLVVPLDLEAIAAAMVCIERGHIPATLPARVEDAPSTRGPGILIRVPAETQGAPDPQFRFFPVAGNIVLVAPYPEAEHLAERLQTLLSLHLAPLPPSRVTKMASCMVERRGQKAAAPVRRIFSEPGGGRVPGNFDWTVSVIADFLLWGAPLKFTSGWAMSVASGILVVPNLPASPAPSEFSLRIPSPAELGAPGLFARGREVTKRMEGLSLLVLGRKLRVCGAIFREEGEAVKPTGARRQPRELGDHPRIEDDSCSICGGPLWGKKCCYLGNDLSPVLLPVCTPCLSAKPGRQGRSYAPPIEAPRGRDVAGRLLGLEPAQTTRAEASPAGHVECGGTLFMAAGITAAGDYAELMEAFPKTECHRAVVVSAIYICA